MASARDFSSPETLETSRRERVSSSSEPPRFSARSWPDMATSVSGGMSADTLEA